MSVLVLNATEVEELLDMEGCIAAMEEALAALERGEAKGRHEHIRPCRAHARA